MILPSRLLEVLGLRVIALPIGMLTLDIIFVFCNIGFTAEPTGRLPVPMGEQLAKARDTVKDLYSDDFSAAKTPAQKGKLAERLLKQGQETKDDPAGRFALLDSSRRIAEQAGDLDLCLKACHQLGSSFEIETFPLKEAAIEANGKLAKKTSDWQRLAEAALATIDEAIEANDFAAAERLSAAATEFAKKARDIELGTRVTVRANKVTNLVEAYSGVREAMDRLKTEPSDAASHLAAGKFLCFGKGDWRSGLIHLSQGADEALAKMAKRDLEGPLKPDSWVELGDAWLALSRDAKPYEQDELKRRAAYWYRQALPNLSGLSKAKTEKALKDLPSTQSAPPPKVAVKPPPYKAIAGTWKITYSSGATRMYQIDEEGNVLSLDSKETTMITVRGNDAVIEFKGHGKLERVRLAMGLLVVEHFDPATKYPDAPTLVGRGLRISP